MITKSKDWWLIKRKIEYDRSYITTDKFITQHPDEYSEKPVWTGWGYSHYEKVKIQVK